MDKVSVDLKSPSPYVENDTRLHLFKRRLTYRFAFSLLKKYNVSFVEKRMLEIGTGSGFFLKFFSEYFEGVDRYGVEYDERLLMETNRRAFGARCVQGNAEELEVGQTQFDLVVSFQVIEHLYSPEKMLVRVQDLLREDGLFLVTTPNLDGLGAKVMGEKWHGYREDHVSLKTMSEWRSLIKKCGLEEVYAGSTFLTGILLFSKLPFGIINWMFLFLFGTFRWKYGESFVGLYRKSKTSGE